MTYHIRLKPKPGRGRGGFYWQRASSAGTYCGAAETEYDVRSTAKASIHQVGRWDALIEVHPCAECVRIRATR